MNTPPEKKPAAKPPQNIVEEMAQQAAEKATASPGLPELRAKHQEAMARLGALSCAREDLATQLQQANTQWMQVREVAAQLERMIAKEEAARNSAGVES